MIPLEKFSLKYISNNLCLVYTDKNYQYIKLVVDQKELKDIEIDQDNKEQYGH